MGEFKSWCVFKEKPASNENQRTGGAQYTRAYRSDFHWEKCWWSGLLEDTEKRGPSPTSRRWKIFWNFGFNRRAHTTDLTLDLVEALFKKRIISNRFLLIKKGGWSWPPYSPSLVLWTISSGLCKGPALRKQTMISALRKNITDIFDALREDPGISSLVIRNLRRRLERVAEREGGHI